MSFLFPYHWISARFARRNLRREPKAIDVAMIGNYRDAADVRRFGFWSIADAPTYLPWIRYVWDGQVKAQLYMIGSTTGQVAGDSATQQSVERGCAQFLAAADEAIARGAKVVLFAAATKRLPAIETLRARYPNVIFTLGDNLTGLLLCEAISDIINRTGLTAGRPTRACVIAPYGLLGGVALSFLVDAGIETIGIGSKKRTGQLVALHDQFGVRVCDRFEDVGSVDLAVACNSSRQLSLTEERVAMLRPPGRKLIVIDPSEPAGMEARELGRCGNRVLRIDAGNGFHSRLEYVPARSHRFLRMAHGLTWGCFAESLILARNPDLWDRDWFEISPDNMAIMRRFLGAAQGGFDLPYPLCFMRPVEDFSLKLLGEPGGHDMTSDERHGDSALVRR